MKLNLLRTRIDIIPTTKEKIYIKYSIAFKEFFISKTKISMNKKIILTTFNKL